MYCVHHVIVRRLLLPTKSTAGKAQFSSARSFNFVPVKKLRYRTEAVRSMLGGLKVLYIPHWVGFESVLISLKSGVSSLTQRVQDPSPLGDGLPCRFPKLTCQRYGLVGGADPTGADTLGRR